MCGALLYLGTETLLDDLLFKPTNSLINQVCQPKMLKMLNLAGFGMKAWDWGSQSPLVPYSYLTDSLPLFDNNLKSLAEKVQVNCLLAHIRGVPMRMGTTLSRENNHPFQFAGCRIALAHNGDLIRFTEMKSSLVRHIRPEYLANISGSTDSEWIYALLLSCLEHSQEVIDVAECKHAIESVFRIIRDARNECGIDTSSSVNLFLSDGEQVLAVRYCFDFGRYPIASPDMVEDYHINYLSLWYTLGRKYGCYDGEWQTVGGSDSADTVIIASEPLSTNISTWLEVPEYSMLFATARSGQPTISLHYLDV